MCVNFSLRVYTDRQRNEERKSQSSDEILRTEKDKSGKRKLSVGASKVSQILYIIIIACYCRLISTIVK